MILLKKLLWRFLAFFLDTLFVSFIIWGISLVPFINPNIDKINHLYAEQNNSYKTYLSFMEEAPKMVEDSVITEEESKRIEQEYPEYKMIFKDVTVNEDLKNEFIKDIKVKINEQYKKILNAYTYKVNKLTIIENCIAIICYLLYFGIIPYFTKGYTLFKKFMRIRTVSIDEKKEISLINFLLRAFLINEILFVLMEIIGVSTLHLNTYTTFHYWINQAKYIYEMAFLVVLVMRDDQRSIHDLILKTKVVLLDKEGNEVNSVLFKSTEVEEPKKVKEVKTKKTITKKKVKEEVKAIKVDDK